MSSNEIRISPSTPVAAAPPTAAPEAAAPLSGPDDMSKLVIAIHGIGSQLRSDTIRSVARRFGARAIPPAPVMPLGYFGLGPASVVRWSWLDVGPDNPLGKIGFAEVYWADIPEQVVKANDTLEETKAWARTVVSRAHSQYTKKVHNGVLRPGDFELGIGAVDEIAETVGVLENLFAIFGKMGLFKFELGPLLRDYVGDVQLVTDFPAYRDRILYRFHQMLSQIVTAFRHRYDNRDPEIYIVAHSEGTVISFMALLQAMSGMTIQNPEPDPKAEKPSYPIDGAWVKHVRGYMTIGSPIDKHLLLWPAMWNDLKLKSKLTPEGRIVFSHVRSDGNMHVLDHRIQWRNYYDYGDPIGFQLDSAMAFLKDNIAFNFGPQHDYGFSRSWLPGKAHVDYWSDPDVFGHFISDVVLPCHCCPKPPQPTSKPLRSKVSTAIPYLFSFALHAGGVYLLFKAVTTATGIEDMDSRDFAKQVLLLALLLSGVTVAARLPRLVSVKGRPGSFAQRVAGLRWFLAAVVALIAGAGTAAALLSCETVSFLTEKAIPHQWPLPVGDITAGRCLLFIAAFAVAASGWLARRKATYGRWWLIGIGASLIAVAVSGQLIERSTGHLWPLLLASASFLYLWWLGIEVFDLAFIWHRYIRNSVAIDALRAWSHGRDVVARKRLGMSKRR